jgi:hypothetical protein
MSDVKYCPSCGTPLALSAAFCHQCGKKQNSAADEAPVTNAYSTDNTESVPESEPALAGTSPIEEVQNDSPAQTETPAIEAEAPSQPDIEQPEVQQLPPETPVAPVAPQQPYVAQSPAPTPQVTAAAPQPASIAPQTPAAAPQTAPAQKPVPKKKFPWVFTVLWVLAAAAVGLWSYFVLIHPEYDYPVLTEDAQRYILLTVAIALLIYTLSLKLTMKKLKVLPTVLLIIAAVVIFYFFCTVELTDGDLLHDVLTDLTESILPASGN